MTDRELLELAAKAAGISLRFLLNETPFSNGPGLIGEWNPLADDGDALRLAVKLKIDLYIGEGCVQADTSWHGTHYVPYGNDEFAATRRAIVNAAAYIGAAMP